MTKLVQETTIFYDSKSLPATLNAKIVASFLGISLAGAYELFRRSDFPAILIGRRRLVSKDKFLIWLDSQSNQSA